MPTIDKNARVGSAPPVATLPYRPDALTVLPPAALLGLLGAGGGALLARNTGRPVRDKLRGGLKGLLTVLGGYGASVGADAILRDNGLPLENRNALLDLAPYAVGGLGGYQAGKALSKLLSLEPKKEEREKEAGLETTFAKLAASPVIAALRQAKAESDRRNWAGKHRILRALLRQYPEQFTVDSRQGSIIGLTHVSSGFKIHAPAYVMPRPPEETELLGALSPPAA